MFTLPLVSRALLPSSPGGQTQFLPLCPFANPSLKFLSLTLSLSLPCPSYTHSLSLTQRQTYFRIRSPAEQQEGGEERIRVPGVLFPSLHELDYRARSNCAVMRLDLSVSFACSRLNHLAFFPPGFLPFPSLPTLFFSSFFSRISNFSPPSPRFSANEFSDFRFPLPVTTAVFNYRQFPIKLPVLSSLPSPPLAPALVRTLSLLVI